MRLANLKLAALTLLLGNSAVFRCPALSAGPVSITHGPHVGGVRPGSARVFLRTSAPADVAVVYSLDPSLLMPRQSRTVRSAARHDYALNVRLSKLVRNVTYYYDIVLDGKCQLSPPYPQFRTFPRKSKNETFEFVAIADAWTDSHVQNYETIGQAPGIRFILTLGDFPHGNATALAESRQQYRDVYVGESWSKYIAPRIPVFHTWDDHDYGVNNSDKTWHNKKNSLKAFREYRYSPDLEQPRKGVWQSFRFAQAEFFMLDTRSQRDPGKDVDNAEKSMLDGDNIRHGQKDWLKAGLLGTTAKWKFVISSVPFNPTAKPKDAWGAYLTERRELLTFIAEHSIKNIIVLSGDLHGGGRLDDGTHSGWPQRGVYIPEMNVPTANDKRSERVGCSGGICGEWSEGEITRSGGHGVITVDAYPPRVTLETRDYLGNTKQRLVVHDQE